MLSPSMLKVSSNFLVGLVFLCWLALKTQKVESGFDRSRFTQYRWYSLHTEISILICCNNPVIILHLLTSKLCRPVKHLL